MLYLDDRSWIETIIAAADPRPLRERVIDPRDPPKGLLLPDGGVIVGAAAERHLVKTRRYDGLRCLGLDLVGIDLCEEPITSSTFVACDFRGARFERAEISSSTWLGCVLEHADFGAARIEFGGFAHSFMAHANLAHAVGDDSDAPELRRCDLRGVVWRGTRWRQHLSATECAFGRTHAVDGHELLVIEDRSSPPETDAGSLDDRATTAARKSLHATVVHDRFGRRIALANVGELDAPSQSIWCKAEFWYAHLGHADLAGRDLRRASFNENSLAYADLRGARLDDVYVKQEKAEELFRGALIDAATRLPADIDVDTFEVVRV